jgi:hypothetical protein
LWVAVGLAVASSLSAAVLIKRRSDPMLAQREMERRRSPLESGHLMREYAPLHALVRDHHHTVMTILPSCSSDSM